MKTRGWLIATICLLALSGCSGGDSDTGKTDQPTAEQTPTVEKDARYGTVAELKDAAVEAGYVCKNWKQTDKVTLAAESGSCSDADVFATYSSDGNLQSQLETTRSLDEMFAEQGIEKDPTLVGPNWTINGQAGVDLQPVLGGTVER